MSELAWMSCASVPSIRRGTSATCAGWKSCSTQLEAMSTRNAIHTPVTSMSRRGSSRSARMMLTHTISRRRSHRSTKTPAIDPRRIEGTRNEMTVPMGPSVDAVRR